MMLKHEPLSAYAAARAAGGRFLLRIEDIDATRCRPEFEEGALEDLAWLGLEWEQPVRRQSEHMDDYQRALDRLIEAGLVYRCFRTRREILDAIGQAPHGPGEAYRGAALARAEEDRRLAEGQAFAWRLSLDTARETLGEGAWADLSFVEEGQGPDGEHGLTKALPELAIATSGSLDFSSCVYLGEGPGRQGR